MPASIVQPERVILKIVLLCTTMRSNMKMVLPMLTQVHDNQVQHVKICIQLVHPRCAKWDNLMYNVRHKRLHDWVNYHAAIHFSPTVISTSHIVNRNRPTTCCTRWVYETHSKVNKLDKHYGQYCDNHPKYYSGDEWDTRFVILILICKVDTIWY